MAQGTFDPMPLLNQMVSVVPHNNHPGCNGFC